MTILRCSATTCIYNKNELCSKGEIDVIGENARYSDETSCGSFRDRNDEAVKSSCADGCGCEKIKIDCKAEKCTYNENCKCTAAAIGIAGDGACDCRETKCDTFECKC
ncbi:DUF1540 domain-containing protein [Blautia schinkii]|nr:DUF1540 domain-containing protein [Blautia schinkii]